MRTLYLKVLLDSWLKYESLEPLIDFVVCLVQKLAKKQQISKGLFSIFLRYFPNQF